MKTDSHRALLASVPCSNLQKPQSYMSLYTQQSVVPPSISRKSHIYQRESQFGYMKCNILIL